MDMIRIEGETTMEREPGKPSLTESESLEELRDGSTFEGEIEGEISPLDEWIDSATETADRFFSENLH